MHHFTFWIKNKTKFCKKVIFSTLQYMKFEMGVIFSMSSYKYLNINHECNYYLKPISHNDIVFYMYLDQTLRTLFIYCNCKLFIFKIIISNQ